MTDNKASIETEKEKSGKAKTKPGRTILAEHSNIRNVELASRSNEEGSN